MDASGERGEEEERRVQIHVDGSRKKNASSACELEILSLCVNASSLYITDRRLSKSCSNAASVARRTCWPTKVEDVRCRLESCV